MAGNSFYFNPNASVEEGEEAAEKTSKKPSRISDRLPSVTGLIKEKQAQARAGRERRMRVNIHYNPYRKFSFYTDFQGKPHFVDGDSVRTRTPKGIEVLPKEEAYMKYGGEHDSYFGRTTKNGVTVLHDPDLYNNPQEQQRRKQEWENQRKARAKARAKK